MLDDLQLFEQWQRGNRDAGNKLFRRHFHSLHRFFANKVQNDVEELLQETFLACVKNRDRFGKRSSFRTYLFAIARNKLYRYLARKHKHPGGFDISLTSIADMGITPTGRLARTGRMNRLLRALQALPIEQQVLLELYYWEEMSHAELAESYEITQASVRARLYRARNALRKQLQADAEQAGAASFRMGELDDLDSWARQVQEHSPLAS